MILHISFYVQELFQLIDDQRLRLHILGGVGLPPIFLTKSGERFLVELSFCNLEGFLHLLLIFCYLSISIVFGFHSCLVGFDLCIAALDPSPADLLQST